MQQRNCIIYECHGHYYVVQRSPQDRINKVGPGECVALAGKFALASAPELLGSAVLTALDQYGVVEPAFFPWELKALRQQLCGWMEFKHYLTLVKASRKVLAMNDDDGGQLQLIPFDNHHLFPWESGMDDQSIFVALGASERSVGEAVLQAFSYCTYHPSNANQGG